MTTALPPGVWYEAARKRWRVRIFKQAHQTWLSYHKTEAEALTAYAEAVRLRVDWHPPAVAPAPEVYPQTVLDLFVA